MNDPLSHLELPPLLVARLRRLGATWQHDDVQTLIRVLERGLYECEAELRARFTPSDLEAWRAAILALQTQPDDPGFARIGRLRPVRTAEERADRRPADDPSG